jgi:hypothetical protein
MAVKTSTDLVKHLAHELGTPSDLDYLLRTRTFRFMIPPSAAVLGTAIASEVADAADAEIVHQLFTTDKAITITSITLMPSANLTAHDTNYAGLSWGYGDLAAGALTVIKLINTSITSISSAAFTGDWTAATQVPITTTRTQVAASKRVSLTITKPGSGIFIPGTLCEIIYEID